MAGAGQLEPAKADWARLYKAAAGFQKIAPWDWLEDIVLFAVEEPETKEVVYCTVMGAAGLEFGLLAYRGIRGLTAYMLMQGDALEDDEGLLVQDCLSFSLGDREVVDAADRSVHASLGLRFRGRGAWPIFRCHNPVYLPVQLDQQQARMLATALEQACAFAEDIRAGEKLPELRDDFTIFARKLRAQGTWETAAMPLPLPSVPQLRIAAARLQKARQNFRSVRQTWEIKLLALAPMAGEAGQDEFWARVLLCVDKSSGMMLGSNVLEPDDDLQDAFLKTVEGAKALPDAVDVLSGFLEAELRPISNALGIKVRRVARLRQAEKASKGLTAAFGSLR